ncbi:hypothetical protein HH310_07635 [Actinoplanes sp. TBRC 11911]|uniref:LppU/SCO3897 family protein n=1 Tax=Actinoplanes sp. TBRC 11911 TaxID=2729386 RepID=UPI00145DB4A0|nr:hypothetical protein [Actinoplanes sp. TBRC 11911]NMO51060.1 hypothetical protein [Actinoplanes sp. TBRC 11911]
MTNPVPPPDDRYPPRRQGGYPPPGQAPYAPPAQGQPQYPAPGQWQPPYPAQPAYPGQPQYAAPGQPYYAPPEYAAPGQPQYAPPGPAQPPYPPEAGQPTYPVEKKKGRRLLIVALFVLVLVVIGGLRYALTSHGDATKDAKAGDCLSAAKNPTPGQTTKTSADVVDCGSTDAKFTVVARVDGENDVESDACTKYFKAGENFFVYASKGGGTDYLLCLRPTT